MKPAARKILLERMEILIDKAISNAKANPKLGNKFKDKSWKNINQVNSNNL